MQVVETIRELHADPFNKSKLLELHDVAKNQLDFLSSSGMPFIADTLPARKNIKAKPLTRFRESSQLRPIHLHELQEDVVHRGRVIYGTLCVEPFRVKGVMTMLEAAEGAAGTAVRVSIYDDDPAWKRKYASGKKVAIKEPCFKRGITDGILLIRIDELSSIQEVSGSFPGSGASSSSSGATTALPGKDRAAAEALKAEGNKSFGLKHWEKAIDLYTQCIKKCEAALARGDEDGDALKVAVLLPAFSNRAEALLKLGDFDHALADSNKALAIDDGHLKSVCRKARALEGLQEFEKAVAWIEKAMKVAQGHQELETMLAECKACARQSKAGEYDIDAFLQQRAPPPKCADFVGPVEIIRVRDDYTGRGVGLSATKDVKAGELLIVSNALARGLYDFTTEFRSSALVCPILQVSKRSSRAADQIQLLLNLSGIKSLKVCQANNGIVAEDMLECEKRRHFTSQEVEKVVKSHSLSEEATFVTVAGCGLWVLPSLIRHSCVSNVSLLQVGDALFVHAARDIQAGEELLVCYFTSLQPYVYRQQSSSRLGFACLCKRCLLEGSLQKQLRDLNEMFDAATMNFGENHLAGEFTSRLEKKLKSVEGDENKSWVRGSYAVVYLGAIANFDLLLKSSGRIVTGGELLKVISATCPGNVMALHFMAKKVASAMMFSREFEHRDGFEGGLLDEELVMKIHKASFGDRKCNLKDVVKIWHGHIPMGSGSLIPPECY